MKREFVTAALIIVVAVMTAGAQQAVTTAGINLENLPETYLIVKGDTLWDISERFLGDPLKWPEVWKQNDYIINPHLIFPGDTIRFRAMVKTALETEVMPKVEEFVEKAPVVEPEPAEPPKPVSEPKPLFSPAAPLISEASIVESSDSQDMAPDDPDMIARLRQPKNIYTEKVFLRTGFITQPTELPKHKIVEIEDEKRSATKFDVVVMDLGKKSGVKEGDIYAAISVGDYVKHPDTGKKLGVVVRIKSVLKVLSVGDEQSRCLVAENFSPLEKGDAVIPYRVSTGPRFDAWVKPKISIRGTILAIHEPMLSVHIDDILYLDKGSVDGVKPGDRFVIYGRSDTANATGQKTPLGEVQAVNVMSNETAVIVVSLKGEHIEIGDRAELHARCRVIN